MHKIILAAIFALSFAPFASAEPRVGAGGGYHDNGSGGSHSSLTGPNGYHDPAVPSQITKDSLAAYAAVVLSRIGH